MKIRNEGVSTDLEIQFPLQKEPYANGYYDIPFAPSILTRAEIFKPFLLASFLYPFNNFRLINMKQKDAKREERHKKNYEREIVK